MSIDKSELAYWLAVVQLPGMGPSKFAKLLALHPVLSLLFKDRQPTSDFTRLVHQLGVKDPNPDWQQVDKALSWAQEKQCHIVTWKDDAYPALLKQVATAPPILFIKGNLDAFANISMGIVGSRHPSAEGKSNAYHFAFELSRQGFVITSGLAYGVDAASHEGTLAAKGITIAVLGSGVETIYPTEHTPLAKKIIDGGGALVSEFALHAQPLSHHFPRRNRIISGISQGLLVVECSLKSGSLITAGFALEQGREVFALPGSIHNPLAKGCHALIRQGAKCVDTVAHIMEEFPNKPAQAPLPLSAAEGGLAKEGHPILSYLSNIGVSTDYIIEQSGLTAEKVCSMLLELELLGAVEAVPGGYIRK